MQNPSPSAILLAEDDPTLGFLLSEYLTTAGFAVSWAKDGADTLRQFNAGRYDLCLLDVMMPALDGFTVAELIRQRRPEHPIIFLTAKSMHADVQRGFRAGADDYLKKPVNEEELLARIHAVLKRSANASPTGSGRGSEAQIVFQIGRYFFDSEKMELRLDSDVRQLTEMEASVLKMLCQRLGSLVQREFVLQKLWGRNDFLARKSMDVFISRLRKYLSKDENVRIENVHGSGFVLEVLPAGEESKA